jgi:2,3,4,5-tetrahydropyridine-2-carboxylate N-succinyltransferase
VIVNAWLRHAILLLFRLRKVAVQELGPFVFQDCLELKASFPGVRVVPGASARYGAHIAPGAVLMPSYVNVGAYVGENSMIDTFATVGSCAQVGRNVHVSGGVGLGGVLEPPQAAPVIVEDDAMIGSRSILVEGSRVGQGAVVGAGVILSSGIPVIDTDSGEEVSRGVIPPWTVAVGGTRPREFAGGTFGLPCVLIVAKLTPGERHNKAELNELLRKWHAPALS